jgi:hypothetical protein
MTTEAANATTALPTIFFGMQGDALRAYLDEDMFRKDLGAEAPVINTVEQIIESNDIPLAAIVVAFNRATKGPKSKGFKTRAEGASALFDAVHQMIAAANAAEGKSETEKLAAAVKPAKEKKPKKEKTEGAGEGRASPLAKKFWSRSGNAIKGRRLGGTGVGINALQYIINNPGVSTEDYIANSGGGRYVDLQYDLDYGNIVELKGATPEERQAEIAALAEQRKGAEEAEAKRLADAEAAKKAKADAAQKAKDEKAAAKKAAAEKAAADKAAADKAAADKAAADAAALEKAKEADAKATA